MARSTNTRVVKRHIILCEGRDAEEFMINFLNSVKSDRADFLHHEIQVFEVYPLSRTTLIFRGV